MPFDAVAGEAAAGRHVHFASAVGVGDAHSPAGDGVPEMPIMIVTFMPDARRKCALEDPVLRAIVQRFADGSALPACLQRVGETSGRRAGGSQRDAGDDDAANDTLEASG